jgi:hypothetical protein
MKKLLVLVSLFSAVAFAEKYERNEVLPVKVCAVTLNAPQSAHPTKELAVDLSGITLVGKNISVVVGKDFLVGCGFLAPSVSGKNLPQKGQ